MTLKPGVGVVPWTAEARGQGGQLTPTFRVGGQGMMFDPGDPTFSSHRSSLLLYYWRLGLRTAKNPVICIVCVVEN